MRLSILRLLLIAVVCGYSTSAVHADLRAERSKRLSTSGRVVSMETRFQPVEPTSGLIRSDVIRVPPSDAVKALRLHFKFNADDVNKAGQAGTWRIVINDLDGNELWAFDSASESDFDEFWSIQLVTMAVEVQLFSTVPNSVLKLACDKRIEYEDPVQEKSIVGEDNSIEITKTTDPNYRQWGRSVAKLTFIVEEDNKLKVKSCTGFLIASDLFVTNDHCPRSSNERRSAVVEFDYDSERARTKLYRLRTELLRNEDLDFAIYRLNKLVSDRDFLKLANEDQNLTNQRPLVIIQHPAGLPKRLTAVQCQIKVLDSEVQPPTDFGHECDTQGGSSGAPVQNAAGLVVGIHHFGFNMGVPEALRINQGVKMGAILDYIEKKNKSLFQSLTISNNGGTNETPAYDYTCPGTWIAGVCPATTDCKSQ